MTVMSELNYCNSGIAEHMRYQITLLTETKFVNKKTKFHSS